jgi:hypothetical protein
MSQYLVIESRNPWEGADVPYAYGLVRDLAAKGHDVTLYLVQNGVMPARKGAKDTGLTGLTSLAKVKVLADDFSLRERGINVEQLAPSVTASSIDIVVDLLAAGAKAIWH